MTKTSSRNQNSQKKSEKSQWLRLWTSMLHSRKIQELSPEIFKFWINFLCAARLGNGCVSRVDLEFLTRLPSKKCQKLIDELLNKNLITEEDGYFFPHDWEEWQFDSDNSTERVRKHRERMEKKKEESSRNGDETFHETEMERSGNGKRNSYETPPETETDTETEKRFKTPPPPFSREQGAHRKTGKDPAQQYAPVFEAFWREYPRKIGKGSAYKAWGKLKPPLEICLSTLKWQKKTDQWLRDNGQYIPHPATWLNQRRWEDEEPQPGDSHVAPTGSGNPARTKTFREIDEERYRQNRLNYLKHSGLLPTDGPVVDAGLPSLPDAG